MLCSTRSVSGKCQQQKPQQQPEAFAEVVDGKKSFFLFPLASVRFFYRYKKTAPTGRRDFLFCGDSDVFRIWKFWKKIEFLEH